MQQRRQAMTAGTNQAETVSASRWIGARLRCACATIWTMRASIVSAPTFSARITRLPVPLMVPPMTLASGAFCTGIDSPVTIDSSTVLRPSITTPSTGTLSPGRTRRRSPTCTCIERHLLILAVAADAPCRLWREVQEGANGAAGLLARPQFENLPEQHQHGDDRGGFVVDRDDAALLQACRKQPRREGRGEAVEIGGADAERDQAEHVERAVANRRPAAHEKRPAGPQHHRGGEHELKPHRDLRRDVVVQVEAREMRSHFQDDRRGARARRRSRNAGSCRGARGSARFPRPGRRGSSAMPQIGQEPGPTCANLGMHRAGVDDAGRSLGSDAGLPRRQIFFRIGGELAPASARAEEIGATAVAVAVRGLVRIDLHAADRVGGPQLRHSARAQRVPFSLRLETGTG